MKERDQKTCETCKTAFFRQTPSLKTWAAQRFCSRSCNLKKNGYKFSKGLTPWNKGKSDYAKELGFGKWMSGKKQSVETRLKKSQSAKKIVAEGKHNFYIDGRTPIRKSMRRSVDYKLWREAVFARDNWTCQECKMRGNRLEAHHIKSFALFPELRFAIDNGVTVCTPCHAKIDPLRARTLIKNS